MAPLLVLVLGCLIGASVAAPLPGNILEYDAGTHSRSESGTPGQSVTGSYSWQHDGQLYTMNYVADENGYRPVMKVVRIGPSVKDQPIPYAQQVFAPSIPVIPPVPAVVAVAPVPAAAAPQAASVVAEPVAQPAPVQQPQPIAVSSNIGFRPDEIIVENDRPEPAKVVQDVKPEMVAAAEPVVIDTVPAQQADSEPIKVQVSENDDDAIQVTASQDAADDDEPDQLKGTLMMNALYNEYQQQLLEEQQYLEALTAAQQDGQQPSSYSLTPEEEAELTLLQMMQFEADLVKQIESKPAEDQEEAIRKALELEKQLAEQQAYLRELAEAEILASYLQPAQETKDETSYLRELIDYEQQQALLAQLLAGQDGTGYLRQLADYDAETQFLAQYQQQQQQQSDPVNVDGVTVNARELSDYEKALEALYFGGQ